MNKTEEFKLKLQAEQGELYKKIKICGEYLNIKTKIPVTTKYGECLSTPDNLLKGKFPSISSALDKNFYFLNQAIEVHGNLYDYSKVKYIDAHTKIKIICHKHGEFSQSPTSHLSGNGCSRCANELLSERLKSNSDDFIKKAKLIHGDKYDYSKVNYTKSNKKVCIICSIHGEFWQTPDNHLSGYNCKKCGSETYNKGMFGGYNIKIANRNKEEMSNLESTIYIIKCFNENENFYKIGITTKPISVRFDSKHAMPYDYTIIMMYNKNLYDAIKIEDILHSIHSSYSYKPQNKFSGWTECFLQINKKKIEEVIRVG